MKTPESLPKEVLKRLQEGGTGFEYKDFTYFYSGNGYLAVSIEGLEQRGYHSDGTQWLWEIFDKTNIERIARVVWDENGKVVDFFPENLFKPK